MDWWSLSASTGVKNGWCCHQLLNVLSQNLIFRSKTFQFANVRQPLFYLKRTFSSLTDSTRWLRSSNVFCNSFYGFRISLWTNVAFANELEFNWRRSVIKVNITVFSSRWPKTVILPPIYSDTTFITSLFWVLFLHYDTPTCTP